MKAGRLSASLSLHTASKGELPVRGHGLGAGQLQSGEGVKGLRVWPAGAWADFTSLPDGVFGLSRRRTEASLTESSFQVSV